MARFSIWVVAIVNFAWAGGALGQGVPPKDDIPTTTYSPHARYGVTVPKLEDYKSPGDQSPNGPKNKVVEIKTAHVLGAIQADVAFAGENHEELEPWWTADESMLLWQVDGKWGYATEVLVKLADGKIKSQVDILSLLQQEILRRTRAAVPTKYAAVKAQGKGDGSWFKDGFAIDCVLTAEGDDMKFPMPFHVFLTSNPKSIEGMVTVDSRMSGTISENGTIVVNDFHLGTEPPARDFITPSQLPQ